MKLKLAHVSVFSKNYYFTLKKGWSEAEATWKGVRFYLLNSNVKPDSQVVSDLCEAATKLKHPNVENITQC